jgi:glycosyltransferase involved in cell wall biosynthesis
MVKKRITLVADQALGYHRTGGLGTATTFLALALGRLGHDVDILNFGDLTGEPPPDPEWLRLYDEAGVPIRFLEPHPVPVTPSYFGRMRAIETALLADPPDVVVVQDLGAPGYVAIRLRQLGLAFENTSFVVYCHGSRQWITNMARKVRVLPGALAITVLEQACVELADAVVSPSAYMVEWMRAHGWDLPAETHVIPLITRTAATGEALPERQAMQNGGVHRLVFFGRLEERKGIRAFVAGLNELPPGLLRDVEVEFLGRATTEVTPATVDALLSETTKSSLRRLTFSNDLDQHEALARLSQPGTLAVMPSTEDNSPAVLYECLERGIPFIAGDLGGGPELIAEEDRARVLFNPTPSGVRNALERALTNGSALRPARPAFDGGQSVQRWAEIVEATPRRPPAGQLPQIGDGEVDWVVVAREDCAPSDQTVETLARAQAASGAEIVTCGMTLDGTELLFPGDAGGPGVLANGYGTVALIRRSLLADSRPSSAGSKDPMWPLLARLALRGAPIVSVPRPLVQGGFPPGSVDESPGDALAVVDEFERALPGPFRSLAELAAGLAAEAEERLPTRRLRLVRRILRRVR